MRQSCMCNVYDPVPDALSSAKECAALETQIGSVDEFFSGRLVGQHKMEIVGSKKKVFYIAIWTAQQVVAFV